MGCDCFMREGRAGRRAPDPCPLETAEAPRAPLRAWAQPRPSDRALRPPIAPLPRRAAGGGTRTRHRAADLPERRAREAVATRPIALRRSRVRIPRCAPRGAAG